MEAGDSQCRKFKWRDRESNPGPLAPQAKSLTTAAQIDTCTAIYALNMVRDYSRYEKYSIFGLRI